MMAVFSDAWLFFATVYNMLNIDNIDWVMRANMRFIAAFSSSPAAIASIASSIAS